MKYSVATKNIADSSLIGNITFFFGEDESPTK